MGETHEVAARELGLGEVLVQHVAHGGVRRVDQVLYVLERRVSRRQLLGRPAEPRRSLGLARERCRADSAERLARRLLVRRGSHIEHLPLACGTRRHGVEDGVVLRVGEVLRLVEHDQLHVVKASPAAVRAGHELYRAAVLEVDGLLAVGAADGLHLGAHLGVPARILEVARESAKRLLIGLHAVGGVYDVPAAHHEEVGLVCLKARVLAVLSRHVQPARDVGGGTAPVAGAPYVQHVALPREEREAQVLGEGAGVLALGVGGVSAQLL